MKYALMLVLGGLVLMPQSASAGVLYGTVRLGEAPAAQVNIAVACPGFDPPGRPTIATVSDARGSFSLRVPTSGRCEMRVRRGDQVGAPFEVFVSTNPMRFDFVLDRAMNRVR